MRRTLRFGIVLSLVLALPALAAAEQLEGFKMPAKGKKGVFSPGLIRGYGEHQVIPFKANIDPTDLEDAAIRAAAEGSPADYLITVMIPTFSDHAPPRDGEANAMSECLFGKAILGEFPQSASVGNYKMLPALQAPAKDLLGKNGSFVFGVVAYQPSWSAWEASTTIGEILAVENRFFVGHPVFPNGVTGLRYDVHFNITNPPTARGKQVPPPLAATIQFGARLAASGLEAIVPPSHPDHGTIVPGACSFHPGPGLLHVAYEVGNPTGRATVPIKCTFAQEEKEDYLVKICGVKWDDSVLDHTFDVGDSVIPDVKIELLSDTCDGTVLDSRMTDENGRYCVWTVVPEGSTVRFVIVEDSAGPEETIDGSLWVQTTPQTDCSCSPIGADYFPVGTGVYCEEISGIREDVILMGRNFGNIPPQTITVEGTKWCDYEIDHSYDAGDQTLADVRIELRDGGCNGDLLDSDLTDGSGKYSLTTQVQYGSDVSLYVVEVLGGEHWVQTTPQTDCDGNPIHDDWFTPGDGVYIESFQALDDVLLPDRNFGNVRLAFGDVGERTPGFWCSQVHLERDGQGGSQPCNDRIRSCGSGSAEERLNKAIDAWEARCDGLNQWIFADRVGKAHDSAEWYGLDDLAEILCPQDGTAEHHQLARQLLALLGNVTDCPCVGEPCGSVGSPNCEDQEIYLGGQFTTVGYALELACDGAITHEDIAAINENRITVTVHDCGL